MAKPHRVAALLGAGAAAAVAALAAFIGSTGISHAEVPGPYQTCDDGVCLVMDTQNLADWSYKGIRPFITDWQGEQSYLVQATQADGSTVDAGSYTIKIDDTWSSLVSMNQYHYGDFTPNGDISGLDLGWFDDMSGATVYHTSFLGGLYDMLSMNDIGPHDMDYFVFSSGDFTNVVVTGAGGSADYIQIGDADPVMLWNSLFHSWVPEVPDWFQPSDPFAGMDFDPCQFGMCDLGSV